MAYTDMNNYTYIPMAGPRSPLYPSLYLNSPAPGYGIWAGPPPPDYFPAPSRSQIHQVDYRQTPTKGRRASQSAQPYDIGQSPTRSRFQHDPDMSNSAYMDGSQGYYAPSLESRTAKARPRATPLPGEHSSQEAQRRRSSSRGHCRRGHVEKKAQTYLPGVHGPTNHLRVPQKPFQPSVPYDRRSLRPSVQFFVETLSEPGVSLSTMTSGICPTILNKDDLVLEGLVEKKINVFFLWPGYESKTCRIPTHNGAVTRQGLLVHLCDNVRKWMEATKKANQVDSRFHNWAIGNGIDIDNVFITELVHRGGADWQVELWVTGELY